MRFGRALKGYTFKEFTEVLNGLGFFEHHRNSTHAIFTDSELHYVTVPYSYKKEINHMMTTVTLQRIKNKQLRKLYYMARIRVGTYQSLAMDLGHVIQKKVW